MLAVVATSDTPLLLLAGDLTVIAASTSFCLAFDIDPATVRGKPVLAIGDGEWNVPQLGSLLMATASGAAEIHAYELDLRRPNLGVQHLVLNAHRVDYEDKVHVRLLLAVADVTQARASEKLKDDLIRDKAILLREVQHRIANSLQIIASVLLQSARRVQSEETRGHLKDAHSRVMSIASVQQQLAQSTEGDVSLRPYFTQLCSSLGASMIEDPARLSIQVAVDDAVVSSEASISLGLIVTELVINALKHAFPEGRPGKITVHYGAHGPNWTLSVFDDGIGMPTDPQAAKPGLGTSIVEALASQLEADVRVGSAAPGTKVEIVHSGLALVHDAAAQAV
ncbi:sensor histidine kinase [Devosia sp. CN2-171]|uniref:sensor histidine kinase n=1 Tax=Devosia sp. CN2-171 TaxID=3400909 RepID=UPI003BF83F50